MRKPESRSAKRRPIGRRPRRAYDMAGMPRRLEADEEEFMDLDLDEILDVDEDEIEEVAEEECPPGCVPAEEVEEEVEEAEEAVEEAEEEEEGEEKEAAAEEPEEKEATPAEAPAETSTWAPLYNKNEMDRLTAEADVTLWLHEDEQDPHYIVLANGRPLAEIRRSDLDLDEDNQGLFTAEVFPKGLIENIDKYGLANILNELPVRYYADQVTRNAADAQAKADVAADMEAAYQERVAELKRKFVDNVQLAIEASTKNVFLKNPLRDAVRQAFGGLGVPDSVVVDLFENAMQRSAAEYFKTVIDQADEWLGFEKDALAQVKKTIHQAEYSHPADRGLPIAPMPEPETTTAEAVPVRSVSQQPPQRQAAPDQDNDLARVKNLMRRSSSVLRGK